MLGRDISSIERIPHQGATVALAVKVEIVAEITQIAEWARRYECTMKGVVSRLEFVEPFL